MTGRRTALVTGITGFVGRHLARALKAKGLRVCGISRGTSSAPDVDAMHVGALTSDFVAGVLDAERPGVVFHLAANRQRGGSLGDFRGNIEDNVLGTLALAEASVERPEIERFVAVGTCEEYGSARTPYVETAREAPVSAYSLSKTAATHLLQTLHRTHGLPAVIVRPSLAYGPGQGSDMFLPALIESLLDGRRFPMSHGAQTRDYVYIGDLVDALVLASTAASAVGQAINVGSGEAVVLRDLARRAAQKVGPDAEPLLDFGAKEYRASEIMSYVADNTLAKRLLGWTPATSLDDGLARTIEHLRRERGTLA